MALTPINDDIDAIIDLASETRKLGHTRASSKIVQLPRIRDKVEQPFVLAAAIAASDVFHKPSALLIDHSEARKLELASEIWTGR